MSQTATFLDEFKYSNFEDYKGLSNKKGIYLIRNTVNNNLYVGSTVNTKGLRIRIYQHYNTLKNNIHHNDFLQNSINKYGINNFRISILLETTTLTDTKLRQLEKEYIDYYSNKFTMFNIADPIDFFVSPYTIEKRKASLRKIRSVTQGVFVRDGKYVAKISRVKNNKQQCYILGTFDTIDDATGIYKQYCDKESTDIETYMTSLIYKKLENTQTKYLGVHITKCKSKPYCVRTYNNKKLINLGHYATAKEAAIVYNNYLLSNNLVSYNRPLNIIK